MPSLSINAKDLSDLGISTKDLLKAIAQTKSNTDNVIKIKKKKRKKNRKAKQGKMTGMSKVSTMNPFPTDQPKFSQYPQTGGGGGPGFPMSRVEVRTETANTSSTKQEELAKQQQQQLELFQAETRQQLEEHNKTLNSTRDATKMLFVDRFQPNRYFPSQNNPPPVNLSYQPFSTFRDPMPVNRQDRFGIMPMNDLYSNARPNDGFSVEELPPNDEFLSPPISLPISEESDTQNATDTQPIDFQDIPSDINAEEIQYSEQAPPITPSDELTDFYPQAKEEMTPRAMPFTSYVPTQAEEKSLYDEIPENLDTLVEEVKMTRGRGRPRGSTNKPKNPLTSNEVHETRSNHNPLIGQQPTNFGISPMALAKENHKKQQTLNQFFKGPPEEKRRRRGNQKKNDDDETD